MASSRNTARMFTAARSPLAIGLNARPVSEAVVRRPKPAPRAVSGMTVPAAVYAAVVAVPIAIPNSMVPGNNTPVLPART